MVKINQKKQLNLPQLIEWGFENDMRNKNFESEGGAMVYFDYDGNLTCARGFVPQDFFTITSEEDITEDTEFKSMVEVTTDDLFAVWEHASISTWKNEHSKEFHAYIDGKFKLIWRNGKLVE